MVFPRFVARSFACAKCVAVLAVAATVVGCASIRANVTVVNLFGTSIPANTSLAVFPLDPEKAGSAEFSAVSANLSQAFVEAGFKVEAIGKHTKYLALIDYAVEIGIDAPWERRFVLFVYEVGTDKQVYRARVVSEGQSKNIVEVATALGSHVVKGMRSSRTGSSIVSI